MVFFCPSVAKMKVLSFFERPVMAGRFGTCGLAVLSTALDGFYRCDMLLGVICSYGTSVSFLGEGLLSLLPFANPLALGLRGLQPTAWS